MLPIRFQTDEDFAALSRMLREQSFNETALCARAEVPSIYTILTSKVRQKYMPPLKDTLDALMWVLLEGRPLAIASWQTLIPAELADSLAAFGLVVEQAGDVICPIALYPIEDLFVISDRNSTAPDNVYPALISETRQFLDVIPRSPCGSFLELCAGTGIAAMIPARDFATHSYAFDIAERSVQFAEFNRRLNGLPNMTNLAGDLYAPAGSKTFDRIVAHPPYVPVLKPKAIFHDGGDDGEQIVRRIVEGLPAHLAPGGQFAMQAMGSDREEAPYEHRVRKWLGAAHGEFQIALVWRSMMDPAVFVAQSVMRGNTAASEIDQWHNIFSSRGVKNLVYGTLLINRRRTESEAPFTVRRQRAERSSREEMTWLMDWEGAVANGTAAAKVLDHPLTVCPDIELRVLNRMEGGSWVAANYVLLAGYPFSMECDAQPWMAYLLGQTNGKTGRELWTQLIAEEVLRPDTPLDQFATALAMLVSGGFLHL